MSQDKYTKSARGQQCQIRIPGYCSGDPATTVLAHLNGGGMAVKHLSIHGAYSCNICHDIVDGRRTQQDWDAHHLEQWHLEGVIRTQKIMIDDGVLVI